MKLNNIATYLEQIFEVTYRNTKQLNGKNLEDIKLLNDFVKILINHFNYSINDIHSYDELTSKEKEFIPKELFNTIICQ